MKVFKFGGASVKNASAVKNVGEILKSQPGSLIVVVSAMDKMTNLLEKIHAAYILEESTEVRKKEFKDFHFNIAKELFQSTNKIFDQLEELYELFEKFLKCPPHKKHDYEYDRLISFGELFSTLIIEAYIKDSGIDSSWVDVRKVIKTDSQHRRANVNWEASAKAISIIKNQFQEGRRIVVTQGFIGSCNRSNETTTLGREGSDYSASILAFLINAAEVCIWKDVPGMLNADPKYFNNTVKLDLISYREAIELSYYGASVIHPKTIKPLQNKDIPLCIKSFEEPTQPGSIIQAIEDYDSDIPSYIFKPDQTLLSISPLDFSFIQEDNLSEIFQFFNEVGIRINLMQNSAINFSIVFDTNPILLKKLTLLLSQRYSYKFNSPLRLLTIRHYNELIIKELTFNFNVLLTQKTRNTIRIVMKSLES